jgi:methyl-accepting chemotaxis protein
MMNLRISTRLYALVAMFIIALGSILTFTLFEGYRGMEFERKAGLESINRTAISILERYHAMEVNKTLTRGQAQNEAKATIGAMRYGEGSGYLWINDMHPNMVMHPTRPELDGTDLSKNEDPNGKFLFVEFVKVVKAQSHGFVDYYWPKPDTPEPVEKYSHVVGFKPWGWVVGTGVYVDDLKAAFFQTFLTKLGVFALASTIFGAIAWLIVSGVTTPLAEIRHSMKQIAEGNGAADVPYTELSNEVGSMAKALFVLRDNVNERSRFVAREGEQQRAAEDARMSGERELRRAAEKQVEAIGSLGHSLEALANGDLTVQVGDLGSEFEKLREDFNRAVNALNDVIQSIARSSNVVNDSASSIREATTQLSSRTEQQAAALEETAAALDQITTTVGQSSQKADQARTMVAQTKNSAGRSGQIVRSAVDAMGRIEDSSSRISQIIGVIDEIAFQTNLLALNAGVEAARAGEAGRGFAVVAQEVRELAQRSSNAAREIKDLITSSVSEVEGGVSLVRSTGDALDEIVNLVNQVDLFVDAIASSSREQATALREVNIAVNQMDQMTQQNAAMVEETTAGSVTLADESDRLRELLARFALVRKQVGIRKAA